MQILGTALPVAGQMLRIVLRTSKPMSWSPGQWVYVGFPALSWIQTHPFTIACSYVDEFEQLCGSHDSASPARRDAHLLVLLVRARNGLTRRLWDHVTKRCEMHAPESATSTDTVFPTYSRDVFSNASPRHLYAHNCGLSLIHI